MIILDKKLVLKEGKGKFISLTTLHTTVPRRTKGKEIEGEKKKQKMCAIITTEQEENLRHYCLEMFIGKAMGFGTLYA